MNFLTEKQLKNLTTERLNALRKTVVKENAKLQYEASKTIAFSEEVHKEASAMQEYYDLIKEIMEDREHIEKPKAKEKRNKRDTIRGKSWEE